jgi:hypothetical protein
MLELALKSKQSVLIWLIVHLSVHHGGARVARAITVGGPFIPSKLIFI